MKKNRLLLSGLCLVLALLLRVLPASLWEVGAWRETLLPVQAEKTQAEVQGQKETGGIMPSAAFTERTAIPFIMQEPKETPLPETPFPLKSRTLPVVTPRESTAVPERSDKILPLLGITIGVDAGHGGYDGGCLGRNTLEKEVNLHVALCLRKVLEERGATVVMTRTTDMALVDESVTTQKKRTELNNRLQLLEKGRAEVLLSIHMNYYEDSRVHGAQVFFREGNEKGRLLSGKIRESMQQSGITLHGQNALVGDFYMLSTLDEAVLIECGFLSNEQEEKLLSQAAYQEKLSLSIAKGVEAYLAQTP